MTADKSKDIESPKTLLARWLGSIRMNGERLSTAAVLAVLVVTAFLIRAAGSWQILQPDGTRFWEFDPYYHVWRVLQTLREWPHVPVFDTAMNTPRGAVVIWPPLYDLSVATLAKACGCGAADTLCVERVAAWVPALLGALTLLPTFFLARRLLRSKGWAFLAAALLAVSPTHAWYSRLGFVDHHVAVTLAAVLMLLAFVRALDAPYQPDGGATHLWSWLGGTAPTGAMVLGFLIWNGFLFFVFVLDAWLLTLIVLDRAQQDSRVWKLGFATHVGAALVLVPFVKPVVAVSNQPFSPLMLSWLSVAAPFVFALIAGLEGVRRALGGVAPRWRRVCLTLPALAALALILPRLPGLAQGVEWLLASDRFMGSVVESGSSFVAEGSLNLYYPYVMLSGFYLVAPLALILLARELRSGGERGRWLLLVSGTLLFLMSVLQRRFAEPFAPLLGILAADLLRRLWKAAVGRAHRHESKGVSYRKRRQALRQVAETPNVALPTGRRLWCALPVAGALVVAYAGSPSNYAAMLKSDARYSAETYADLKRFAVLLEHSDGSTPPGVARREGAVSVWDLGHRILYITHLPVISNNFGVHIGQDSWNDAATFFMENDEARALALLEGRRVRYVISDFDPTRGQLLVGYVGRQAQDYFESVPDSKGGFATLMKAAFTRTLYFRLGSSYMGSEGVITYPDGRKVPVAPLHGFRLLLETEKKDATRPLRIFERVAGARLTVAGAPAEVLRLRYEWRTPEGRQRRYQLMLQPHDGRHEAVVPYSSERPDLGQTSNYRLESAGGQTLEVRVGESDVREGHTVAARWPAGR